MSTPVEDRLAAYAATLDAAAEQHRDPTRPSDPTRAATEAEPDPTQLDLADRPDARDHRRVLVGVGLVLVALIASLGAWRGLSSGHRASHVSTASSVPHPPTTASTPTTSPTTASTAGPSTTLASPTTSPAATSATGALEPFFASAAATDQALAQASAVINAQLSSGRYDPTAAGRAIDAADPTALAGRIPAGLSTPLETAVLVVWSELDSRWAALCDPQASTQLSPGAAPCYVNGTTAARRFAPDLAAARALAAASPAPAAVAPSSRAVAEVALQVDAIHQDNHGCGATGGFILTALLPVTWVSGSDGSGPHQGTIDGMAFQATYTPGSGWTTRLNVC